VSYGVFAFLTPILLALPAISLLTCWGLIDDTWSALVHLPGVLGTLALFAYLGGSWDAPRMACGLWPVYLRAFFLAMRPEKIRYLVTDKVEAYGGRHIGLILPQLGLLVAAGAAWFAHHATHGVDTVGMSMAAVIAFNIWWMAPVLYLGLRPREVRLRHQREPRRPLRVTFVASSLAGTLSLATPLIASTTPERPPRPRRRRLWWPRRRPPPHPCRRLPPRRSRASRRRSRETSSPRSSARSRRWSTPGCSSRSTSSFTATASRASTTRSAPTRPTSSTWPTATCAARACRTG
jgi:hypothetical protein